MPFEFLQRLALLLCLVGASHACAAGMLPPSRTDIGTTMIKPTGEARSGLRFSTGAHLASASSDEAEDYDFGAGYVYERTEAPGGDITDKHVAGEKRAGAQVSQGAYLSVERVLNRSKSTHQRTWLGMRAEYLHASEEDGGPTLSALARLNWEVYGHVEGAGSTTTNCGSAIGFGFGTAGLGFYAEGGARRSLDGDASFVATVGLSLRLPFLAGFAFDLCPD